MTDPNKTVFISYRRSASSHLARAVFMDLRANGWDAFLDVNTIDSGMFDRIILNQIAARAHFVLVLSPGSLERCANEGDWLRREIEEAMRLNRNIVPVFEEGFNFDREQRHLPESLKDLPRYSSLRIPHDFFDEAMEKLRKRFLKEPFYGEIMPTPSSEAPIVAARVEQVAQSQQEASKNVMNFMIRGQARRLKGDLEGAIANYSEAIHVDPKYAGAYRNRGNARKDNGDIEGAIVDLTEAIKLEPNDPYTFNDRGNARIVKGDIEGAIADYSESVQLDPQYANAYYNRGNARKDSGDIEGAIADYQKYLFLGDGERAGDQEEVEQIIRELKEKLR